MEAIDTINAVMDAQWKAEATRDVDLFMFRLETGRILDRLESRQARVLSNLIGIHDMLAGDMGDVRAYATHGFPI